MRPWRGEEEKCHFHLKVHSMAHSNEPTGNQCCGYFQPSHCAVFGCSGLPLKIGTRSPAPNSRLVNIYPHLADKYYMVHLLPLYNGAAQGNADCSCVRCIRRTQINIMLYELRRLTAGEKKKLFVVRQADASVLPGTSGVNRLYFRILLAPHMLLLSQISPVIRRWVPMMVWALQSAAVRGRAHFVPVCKVSSSFALLYTLTTTLQLLFSLWNTTERTSSLIGG